MHAIRHPVIPAPVRFDGDRVGLVYVDFKTQKRTPKLSGAWFREAAWHNSVV